MLLRDFNLRALNSATKYPSIPTYHVIGDRGRLQEEILVPFSSTDEYEVTEKIDGTNARLVFSTKTGECLIGSREEWLTYVGDIIANPSQGIVDALGGIAQLLMTAVMSMKTDVLVLYGEVYGGRINNAKNYTNAQRSGFRVFDAWVDDAEALAARTSMPLEEIARWRDGGGQPFMTSEALDRLCASLEVTRVPARRPLLVGGPPKTLANTLAWLHEVMGETTQAGLDAHGKPEGVVIRSLDRKTIAKLRFEDYQRSLPRGTAPQKGTP